MKWHEALLPHIPDLQHDVPIPANWKNHRSMLVDMVSVAHNVVIEYDGWYYHSGERSGKSIEYHLEHDGMKTVALLDAGYNVIRVREGVLPHLDIQHELLLQISYKKYGELKEPIELILSSLGKISLLGSKSPKNY